MGNQCENSVFASEDRDELLQIDLSSAQLIIPKWLMPQLVDVLSRSKGVKGYGTTAEAVQLTFNMSIAESFVMHPISEREAKLAKEKEENNDRWYKAYLENQKLEKRIKELEGMQRGGEQ